MNEVLALSAAGSTSYRPFNLEANAFFQLPVVQAQLTARAAERGWSNPLWIRAECLSSLSLVPAPLEAPIAIWLPQCADTFRSLESMPPKAQHTILRNFSVPVYIQDPSHTVLAMDYFSTVSSLTQSSSWNTSLGGGRQLAPSLNRPMYRWQTATGQFLHLFEHSWEISHPKLIHALRPPRGSRHSKRESPPPHPRERMWVSTRLARSVHQEALDAFYRIPNESCMVTTPQHGGLFYNASQLFTTRLLIETTNRVMEQILQLDAKEANTHRFPEAVEGEAQWSIDAAASVGSRQWPHTAHRMSAMGKEPAITAEQADGECTAYSEFDASQLGAMLSSQTFDHLEGDSESEIIASTLSAVTEEPGVSFESILETEACVIDTAADADVAANRDVLEPMNTDSDQVTMELDAVAEADMLENRTLVCGSDDDHHGTLDSAASHKEDGEDGSEWDMVADGDVMVNYQADPARHAEVDDADTLLHDYMDGSSSSSSTSTGVEVDAVADMDISNDATCAALCTPCTTSWNSPPNIISILAQGAPFRSCGAA